MRVEFIGKLGLDILSIKATGTLNSITNLILTSFVVRVFKNLA